MMTVAELYNLLFVEDGKDKPKIPLMHNILDCVMNGENEMFLTKKQWMSLLRQPSVQAIVQQNIVADVTATTTCYYVVYGMKFYCLKGE